MAMVEGQLLPPAAPALPPVDLRALADQVPDLSNLDSLTVNIQANTFLPPPANTQGCPYNRPGIQKPGRKLMEKRGGRFHPNSRKFAGRPGKADGRSIQDCTSGAGNKDYDPVRLITQNGPGDHTAPEGHPRLGCTQQGPTSQNCPPGKNGGGSG